MNFKLILRGLAVLLSLAAIGFLVQWSGLGDMLDQGWVDREIRGKGLNGELLFLGIGILATAVGFPRQIISFMGGYAFGFLQGTLLGLLATVLGCAATFIYARLFGRALVAHRLGGRIAKVDAFVRDNPFTMTLLIRLLPVGSNVATNLAAGVSSVAALPFLFGSAAGFIPQTAVFALVGSGVSVDPVWRIGLGTVLFVVSGVLGVYLYRSLRHGKVYDEELEHEMEG
ncbi:MAG: VTT domain-containing protein [Gallionellaceae bacterium]|nr:VTT domain-containing protein [Gallionellaceae bacterium]